ncbi:acetolactate synthase large subunit [Pontivivens ytuae]|uniref:Acetolactate synthase large subunit n=1 Tax=Pontivivens ytuae TaxID=2789856 RepID=A0A7S9LTA2_9RHOB|nr:acetolactate synthase large subunit [Pontivivens ytuae]QPH54902.1 acetolactate synthase large subunit [Pontivivens ytuae]
MKASDLFVKCLEAEGITRIFGVPGEENADFMMSLRNSSIEFVLTRHEQGAAFMAEAHGRLTGEPGVCLGTLGPGATNLLTGVADANMDRAPLIVITGQAATTRQHKESHQVMDVVDMYRSVTKWSHGIIAPDTIPEVVRKAVRLARKEKPGAVHLELAENVAKMEVDAEPLEPRRFWRPEVSDHILDKAWDAIRGAKQPIIIAGNGAIRKRCSAELRAFVEATGIGVLHTFMGKGSVDMDDPRCLFTIGIQQRDWPALAVERADVVICIGYDLVEYPPRLWNAGADKAIVHLDFEPAEIDANYHPAVEGVGDIAEAICGLTDRAKRDGVPDWDFAYQRKVREKMLAEFAEWKDDDAERVKPQKALWEVRDALGPSDLLLSGVGAHKMWIGRYYQCHEPNTCLIPNGFCSMGMPLPGAVGATLDFDGKILAIAGDGDVMMNVQEMETACRLDADITVMVWVDGGYGLIEWKQDDEFGGHTDLAFGNPDWLHLAKAFGWEGWVVEGSSDLREKLDAALAHKGPSLIAVPIDYRENVKLTERLGDISITL